MSTNISRGPKVCPSCGKENPPTAPRCWLCFTPLGRAFQTTTAPAPGEVRLSVLPRTQRTADPGSGCSDCASAVGVLGVVILVIIAAVVTFGLICAFNPPRFTP
jgi:hypothetical protein